MKTALISFYVLCLFLTENACFAQAKLFAGYGNYENAYLGINCKLKERRSFHAFLGVQPYSSRKSFVSDIGFGYRVTFKSKIHLQLKSVLWYYNSMHFQFINTANGLEIGYAIQQKDGPYGLDFNVGGLYNSALSYKRKSWEEVAWPKEWVPSFSMAITYAMRSHE